MKHNRFILGLVLFLLGHSVSWARQVNLRPPQETFNVLMLNAFSTESHLNCFLPLAEALAERGHKVTILSSLPPKTKHPNIQEIFHGIPVFEYLGESFYLRETDPTRGLMQFKHILPKLSREMYDVPVVKELYKNRTQFQLILIDKLFNEPAFPFLEGRKYITVDPMGFLSTTSATLGNVLNPSYVEYFLSDLQRPYSFLQRMTNLYSHIHFSIFWRSLIYSDVEKELSKHFPNLPSLMELGKGVSLQFVNTHFSLDIPIPLLPSQIETGGIHCRPGAKLPQDLEKFINGSGNEGVIYFSLGSICRGSIIPDKFKKILVEAFRKVKQRVIWKFEENFEGLPSNILIKEWLPQQDILAHPQVKLFITHGGLLSMQEAIYHATPLLVLPVFGDQARNGQRTIYKGLGKMLIWEDLTVDLLLSTFNEIITNPKYKNAIDATSKSFRDQIASPLEKAVWWSEYFVRNEGAPLLRSPAADLTWIEYLMLDVILAFHVILFIIYWFLKKSFKFIVTKVTSSNPKKNLSKNKKE